LLGLPVRLFPLWVLIDILSFVRLLLSQQPDNTHGIYRATCGNTSLPRHVREHIPTAPCAGAHPYRATRERDPNLANRSRSH